MHISLFLSILLLGFTILNLLQGFGSTLLLPDSDIAGKFKEKTTEVESINGLIRNKRVFAVVAVQRLVRLTLEHPQYPLDYSFPSHEEILRSPGKWLVPAVSARIQVSGEMFVDEAAHTSTLDLLISDFVVVIVSAAIGGIIFSCLGQPICICNWLLRSFAVLVLIVIDGCLLAGSLVGPGGLKFKSEMEQIVVFSFSSFLDYEGLEGYKSRRGD
ncbi:hypothetical protein TEA_003768 [Camellia sinensis var. sinensis]|uniref:Uncharacterized protein n=1 Tax=Camellia sinensis var. sinensis TaxID=542762 RepID=A0A4S4E4T1_CAMSN|nr:hypothetical protein TEA_003768 [Camellia sinensis var. sinensis]